MGGKALEKCFIPYYEEMKRYQGEWHKEKKILFPGYVFAVSEDPEALFLELKRVIGLTKLLNTDHIIAALTPKEVEFLIDFGQEEQVETCLLYTYLEGIGREERTQELELEQKMGGSVS